MYAYFDRTYIHFKYSEGLFYSFTSRVFLLIILAIVPRISCKHFFVVYTYLNIYKHWVRRNHLFFCANLQSYISYQKWLNLNAHVVNLNKLRNLILLLRIIICNKRTLKSGTEMIGWTTFFGRKFVNIIKKIV